MESRVLLRKVARMIDKAWPFGGLCPGPERFGLRNSLRSDSPRPYIEFGTGAQPRLEAPWGGAMGWRAIHAKAKRAGRIRCGPYN